MPGIKKRPRAQSGFKAALGYALLYVSLGFVGRSTTIDGTTFALIWPAGGVAVLWFLVRGARILSVDTVLLAACTLGVNWVTGAPLDASLVLVATNVLQTLVAVTLLRRWCPQLWGCGGQRPLDSPRLLGRYLTATALATAAGALMGTLAFAAVRGEADAIGGLLWFGRNLCSVLTVTTVGLLLGQRLTSPRPRPPLTEVGPAGRLELVAAVVFTLTMYVLAFVFDDLPLAFPLLATTAWLSLRFATLMSAGYATLIGASTIILTLFGIGPFARVDNAEVGALLAQLYVMTIVVTALALSTGRDERQALAAELRRTEAQAVYEGSLRDAIIGSMTEGILVVDDAGEFLIRNRAAAEVLGTSASGLVRSSLDGLVSRHLDGTVLREDERPAVRALRGETVRNMELLVGDDAPGRVLAVSAVPLPRDTVRDRARALLLCRDMTSEHAHREELAAFAGVVAHDLRNPLAAIDGWTEMMADELDGGSLTPELAREYVSRVRSSSSRMRELIGDLLAHATSNARDLNLSPVDVGALVAEVVTARNAHDRVSCGPMPHARADAVLIRQVLDNLVGNALKYVAPGRQPRVEVTGCGSEEGGLTVRVADNGVGLPAGEHEKIFEEFHRAHHREYEGSGLGLSICRRIVHRHGGAISAFDNPQGQGTVFEFTLPGREPTAIPAPAAEAAVQQSA